MGEVLKLFSPELTENKSGKGVIIKDAGTGRKHSGIQIHKLMFDFGCLMNLREQYNKLVKTLKTYQKMDKADNIDDIIYIIIQPVHKGKK